MCSDLVSHLSKVEDPRSDKNKLYPLDEILLLCICAIISGAEGWKDIAEFGRNKLNWLRKFLKFCNGIPSEDCIAWEYGLYACFIIHFMATHPLPSSLLIRSRISAASSNSRFSACWYMRASS
uniref:DDE_Tnp_1-associated n=1 Tax=Candidatus Kentrum sp. MB TaxID=2138164 RepID=A0A450X2W6_9GAMM|nr:MAG: DDE_Tnp_1-associated [Candidatus Kentron sp. MB]VFK27987.1 MAG: DDE_Tnp_1-associated [Candidatus Kentron sp. MB]VFK74503.1 MAG: DDE_Tnp_1-associated [Candidatus Kentron sp. MB]